MIAKGVYSTQTHFFFIIEILFKILQPPPPPQGANGAPYVPKLYASSGKDISKCIEGGSMKLATQKDYVYM